MNAIKLKGWKWNNFVLCLLILNIHFWIRIIHKQESTIAEIWIRRTYSDTMLNN